MSIRVAVVGGGSWGTTVAALASQNTPTVLWCRRPELADQINVDHRNGDYLADFDLPEALSATASYEEAICTADVLVMGVPSHVMRATLRELAPCVRAWVPIVSLSKGLELGTHLRMTQVIAEELPGHPTGVLT
ncbi:MAG TPA: NAD(P)-binding domain-containing protein, partial [Acidimicrobiales bacterium]|nr:NAD(P)-binding domain-containing protein [Acidimicrobiales bacterium]